MRAGGFLRMKCLFGASDAGDTHRRPVHEREATVGQAEAVVGCRDAPGLRPRRAAATLARRSPNHPAAPPASGQRPERLQQSGAHRRAGLPLPLEIVPSPTPRISAISRCESRRSQRSQGRSAPVNARGASRPEQRRQRARTARPRSLERRVQVGAPRKVEADGGQGARHRRDTTRDEADTEAGHCYFASVLPNSRPPGQIAGTRIPILEWKLVERVLKMGGGYVLNFGDKSFADWFAQFLIDIDEDRYSAHGTSKANRLRTFLAMTNPPLVGRVLNELIDYGVATNFADRGVWPEYEVTGEEVAKVRAIATAFARDGAEIPLTLAPTPVVEKSVSNEHYDHILSVCAQMSEVMERDPAPFAGMEEEHLRTHFLVQLNGHYNGGASGETFNYHGKTDILLRHEGKVAFVAECKFWRGAAAFGETVDQLLGYVSWRDTKTAILVFSRNKDTSAVVAQIPGLLRQHRNYLRSVARDEDAQVRCVLRHRDDAAREVTLTVLVFQVPGRVSNGVVAVLDEPEAGHRAVPTTPPAPTRSLGTRAPPALPPGVTDDGLSILRTVLDHRGRYEFVFFEELMQHTSLEVRRFQIAFEQARDAKLIRENSGSNRPIYPGDLGKRIMLEHPHLLDDPPEPVAPARNTRPQHVKVLGRGFHNVDTWVDSAWWVSDGEDAELMATLWADAKGEAYRGAVAGCCIATIRKDLVEVHSWATKSILGQDFHAQGRARNLDAAKTAVLDSLEEIVPGIRGLLLDRPPPTINFKARHSN